MNWSTHPTVRQASTAQLARWRKAILDRDPICKIQGPRCTGIATEADHIRNAATGGAELDPANGQGACHNCHADKTQREALRGRMQWKRKPEKHPGLRGA